jgi:hypothetical protein
MIQYAEWELASASDSERGRHGGTGIVASTGTAVADLQVQPEHQPLGATATTF